MMASRLIALLANAVNRRGDLEVRIGEDFTPVVCVEDTINDDGEWSVVLCLLKEDPCTN